MATIVGLTFPVKDEKAEAKAEAKLVAKPEAKPSKTMKVITSKGKKKKVEKTKEDIELEEAEK